MQAVPRASASAVKAVCVCGVKIAVFGGNASNIGGPSGFAAGAGGGGGGGGAAATGRPCQFIPGTGGSGGGAPGSVNPANASGEAGTEPAYGVTRAACNCIPTAICSVGVNAAGAFGTDARLG